MSPAFTVSIQIITKPGQTGDDQVNIFASVLDFLHLGSSLSVRNFARVGSAASVVGLTRVGSIYKASVVDFLHLFE